MSSTAFSIRGAVEGDASKILTQEACHFLVTLHRSFEETRQELLKTRQERQKKFEDGELLDFLPETKHVREDIRWRGSAPAPGLIDRRVEITGPTDRKMIVNALNSNVFAYMADFEGTPICFAPHVHYANPESRLQYTNLDQHDSGSG